jgi:S1-C subfamily serine protease
VIDPSGLVVMSLTASNPVEMYSRMMAGREEAGGISSEVKEAKIRMADGTEMPAKFVLRDRDLDLAFARPAQKQASPFEFVDLSQDGKADVLDQVLVLSRLGKTANRVSCVSLERIRATVDKPRNYYVMDDRIMSSFENLGAPAFDSSGKVLGLILLRMAPTGGSPSMGDEGVVPIVLPASDVLEVAKQAPEEALKEPKTPEPAKPAAKESKPKPAAPSKPTKH